MDINVGLLLTTGRRTVEEELIPFDNNCVGTENPGSVLCCAPGNLIKVCIIK